MSLDRNEPYLPCLTIPGHTNVAIPVFAKEAHLGEMKVLARLPASKFAFLDFPESEWSAVILEQQSVRGLFTYLTVKMQYMTETEIVTVYVPPEKLMNREQAVDFMTASRAVILKYERVTGGLAACKRGECAVLRRVRARM